jgi:hypothetical protein
MELTATIDPERINSLDRREAYQAPYYKNEANK